jgi:glycine betaine/proline transport system ATP-binding protein
MDEAFSALDPLIRNGMQDELVALQRSKKLTVVFISHDLDEAMRIGDRIAIMRAGSILQVGAGEEILRNPADEHVRSFFGGVDLTNVLVAKDLVEPVGRGGHVNPVQRVSPLHINSSFDEVVVRLAEETSPVPVVDETGETVGSISRTRLLEVMVKSAQS